jgi:hypothetical protein
MYTAEEVALFLFENTPPGPPFPAGAPENTPCYMKRFTLS